MLWKILNHVVLHSLYDDLIVCIEYITNRFFLSISCNTFNCLLFMQSFIAFLDFSTSIEIFTHTLYAIYISVLHLFLGDFCRNYE